MIFNLTSSAIPPTAKVAGFRGSERISQPYQFDVWFTLDYVPGLPIPFDLADAVYAKATLTVALGNGSPFSFHGVLASVRLVRAVDGAALFHARLVPQFWQLLLTKHSRIWTKKSIVEVIEEVLGESGIDYDLRLQNAYQIEEQITQYKESNLAFVQRWMDREGIYYFFEQTDAGDVLVITDNKSAHTSLRSSPVKYFPQNDYNDVMVKQAFDNFAATHNALPASVRLVDYDYAKPLLDVSSTVSVDDQAVGEITEYGGRFFSPGDAARLAKVRAEEFLAKKNLFESTGATTQLSAGYLFTLEDHPLLQYNTEYLVTAIEHHGYDAQFGPAWGSLVEAKYKDVYRIETKCIEASVQYRNGQLTPWPRVDGYENAVVDGAATSQYAQIDDQGRYNLKFKFDEGTFKDGKGTTWVRMAQPHGGAQEGFHFPLRKGVEVICSFLGGDPDRPVIVGVVHNMVNQSVVTQSNHTQNVIRSGSLNHIVMEDTAGQMSIDVWCPIFSSTLFLGYGEWNFHLTTLGRGRVYTKLDFELDVDLWWKADVNNYVDWHFHNTHKWVNDLAVDWTFNNTFKWYVVDAVDIDWMATLDLYVKGATTIKYDNTLGLTVTNDAKYTYNGNVTVDMAKAHTLHVKGHEKYTVDTGRELTISSGDKTHVKGGQNTTVDGGLTETFNDFWTITSAPKTETINGPYNLTVTGDLTSTIGANNQQITTGSKSWFTVGSKVEGKLAAELALNIGVFVELAMALKLSVTAASIGINGFNLGINGINMGTNGIDVSTKPLKLQMGALATEIKALIMKI